MDSTTISLLGSSANVLANSASKTNEEFITEQKTFQTWEKGQMEASMNSASKKVQSFHKIISDNIKVIEEAMKASKAVGENKRLSLEGKWSEKQKINGGVYKTVNKDLNARLENIDDETKRLQKTISYSHVSLGSPESDEPRLKEIRDFLGRDADDEAKRDLQFINACRSGNIWYTRAMLESPIPLISDDAKEQGIAIRRRREDPSRSYSLSINVHLKQQLELTRFRINKSLQKLGYPLMENDGLAEKARIEFFAEKANEKRLKQKRAISRTINRAESYGRQIK